MTPELRVGANIIKVWKAMVNVQHAAQWQGAATRCCVGRATRASDVRLHILARTRQCRPVPRHAAHCASSGSQLQQTCMLPPPAVFAAAAAALDQLSTTAPALAADVARYDASGSSDTLKNVFGAVYVAVLIGFGIRLFTRRAKWSTSEVPIVWKTPPPLLHPMCMAEPGEG